MDKKDKNKNVFYFIYEMKKEYGGFLEVSKKVEM